MEGIQRHLEAFAMVGGKATRAMVHTTLFAEI